MKETKCEGGRWAGTALEHLLDGRTCIIKADSKKEKKRHAKKTRLIGKGGVTRRHCPPSFPPASSSTRSCPFCLCPLGNLDNEEVMNGHIILDNPTRHPDLVVPRLYLCDLHTAQDPVVATSFGITHILSILDFRPTFPHEMDHIKRMHVNLSDNFRENITPHLDNTTAFIREALERDPDNKVLVRRTPSMRKWATSAKYSLTRVPEHRSIV